MLKKVIKFLFAKGWKRAITITALVLLFLIATILTLNYTLFTVKHIEIDGESIYSCDDYTAASNIVGQTLMGLSRNETTEKIEKQLPYACVENLEFVFPNKVVFHVRNRESMFVCEKEDKFYNLDSQLKILCETREKDAALIEIDGIDILEVGDFCKGESKNFNVFCSYLGKNESLKNVIDNIQLTLLFPDETHVGFYAMKVECKNGNVFDIYDIDRLFDEKISMLNEIVNSTEGFEGRYVIFEDEFGACKTYLLKDLNIN